MKKNKLLVIPILLVLLCGCEKSVDKKYTNVNLADDFYIYTDVDTCVQYFVSSTSYNSGNVSPRFNPDGTLKLNKECVKDNAND